MQGIVASYKMGTELSNLCGCWLKYTDVEQVSLRKEWNVYLKYAKFDTMGKCCDYLHGFFFIMYLQTDTSQNHIWRNAQAVAVGVNGRTVSFCY